MSLAPTVERRRQDPFAPQILLGPSFIQAFAESLRHCSWWLTPYQLKCTSEPTGCSRCFAKGVECHYPEPVHGGRTRQLRHNSESQSSDALHDNTSWRTSGQNRRSFSQSQLERPGDSSLDAGTNEPLLAAGSTPSHVLGSRNSPSSSSRPSQRLSGEASGPNLERSGLGNIPADERFDDLELEYDAENLFMAPQVGDSMPFARVSPINGTSTCKCSNLGSVYPLLIV